MTAAYATSTAGLIALTKSLGKELAQEGVLVNAVTPSASETEIFGTLTAERRAQLLERVPMQRFLDPSEVSALAAWLVSAECSFSTNPAFDISGGRATW
jgi:3-oxoacyl-[acyl-carrier protein] reductase